jgi:hypothetical protein
MSGITIIIEMLEERYRKNDIDMMAARKVGNQQLVSIINSAQNRIIKMIFDFKKKETNEQKF